MYTRIHRYRHSFRYYVTFSYPSSSHALRSRSVPLPPLLRLLASSSTYTFARVELARTEYKRFRKRFPRHRAVTLIAREPPCPPSTLQDHRASVHLLLGLFLLPRAFFLRPPRPPPPLCSRPLPSYVDHRPRARAHVVYTHASMSTPSPSYERREIKF